jgi:hypothetical protein
MFLSCAEETCCAPDDKELEADSSRFAFGSVGMTRVGASWNRMNIMPRLDITAGRMPPTFREKRAKVGAPRRSESSAHAFIFCHFMKADQDLKARSRPLVTSTNSTTSYRTVLTLQYVRCSLRNTTAMDESPLRSCQGDLSAAEIRLCRETCGGRWAWATGRRRIFRRHGSDGGQ